MPEAVNKVLIVDDHVIFRQGLIRALEDTNFYKVVGEASDGVQALEKIKELNPDIVIMDISMPNMSGLQAIRRAKRANMDVTFIVLTMYIDDNFLSEAINLGVKGFILKENTTDDLIAALKAVSTGRSYISPIMSDQLINLDKNRKELEKNEPSINNLTTTQRTILRLLSENKTSKEIASDLNFSYRTIQNNRAKICIKLGLKGTNSLLKFAIDNKFAL